MFNDKGKGGYIGKSMSVRAEKAYQLGEKPLSKWTKKEIIEEVEEIVEEMEINNFSMDNFKKLHLTTLKTYILKHSGWHHTGALYNATNFYEININYLNTLTDDDILVLIEDQKKPKRPAEEIRAEKAKREQRKLDRELREERMKLFKYQKKYKSENGFLNAITDKRINEKELKVLRQEKITEKRKELGRLWEKQLPKDHWNWKSINNDDFIESYI